MLVGIDLDLVPHLLTPLLVPWHLYHLVSSDSFIFFPLKITTLSRSLRNYLMNSFTLRYNDSDKPRCISQCGNLCA
jgi:hypothetical protein